MNKNFGQSGEKPRINYHIIEIIIFGDTVYPVPFKFEDCFSHYVVRTNEIETVWKSLNPLSDGLFKRQVYSWSRNILCDEWIIRFRHGQETVPPASRHDWRLSGWRESRKIHWPYYAKFFPMILSRPPSSIFLVFLWRSSRLAFA